MVKFYTEDGTKPLPYDPWTTHPIPVKDIKAAAEKQGVTFRQADILVLRMGFMQVQKLQPSLYGGTGLLNIPLEI